MTRSLPPGGLPSGKIEHGTSGGGAGRRASRRIPRVSGPGLPPSGEGLAAARASGPKESARQARGSQPGTCIVQPRAWTVTLSAAQSLLKGQDSAVSATRVTSAAHREGVAAVKHAQHPRPPSDGAAQPRQEAGRRGHGHDGAQGSRPAPRAATGSFPSS